MNTMLTVIVSPAVAGVVLVVVLAGGSLMYHIVRKKYGYTPERQKELDEVQEGKPRKIHHTIRVRRNVTEIRVFGALWGRRIGGQREKNRFFDKWW